MTKQNNYAGGLSNYIVLKEEKEVICYLHNPYPDCLDIPETMKERFPKAIPQRCEEKDQTKEIDT